MAPNESRAFDMARAIDAGTRVAGELRQQAIDDAVRTVARAALRCFAWLSGAKRRHPAAASSA